MRLTIADKFYTKKEVAKKCVVKLKSMFDLKDRTFLEPTAGNGVFLDYLPKFEAYDLIPEDDRIKQMNIFDFNPSASNYITIGNPPFGKRSKLAIDIFNKLSNCSDIIAFILPVSFMKYGVQKQLNKDFKLVYFELLPQYSFMDRDKEYDVNCVFQIWTKLDTSYKDLRIKKSPSIKHNDFITWQYNSTPEAFKYVYENWDIAVYRQGYKNFSKIFTKSEKQKVIDEMNDGVQFFFVKYNNSKAKAVIEKMDFNQLASRNTATPGFGKADFVAYYQEKISS